MSIFTRRHYIWLETAFAESLIATPHATDREIIWSTIHSFANSLEAQSSMFDKDLFISSITALSRNRAAAHNMDT